MDLMTVFIILSLFALVITLYFNCSACIRDYREVQQLERVQVITQEDIDNIINQRYIMPTAEGVKVESITENLAVINPD